MRKISSFLSQVVILLFSVATLCSCNKHHMTAMGPLDLQAEKHSDSIGMDMPHNSGLKKSLFSMVGLISTIFSIIGGEAGCDNLEIYTEFTNSPQVLSALRHKNIQLKNELDACGTDLKECSVDLYNCKNDNEEELHLLQEECTKEVKELEQENDEIKANSTSLERQIKSFNRTIVALENRNSKLESDLKHKEDDLKYKKTEWLEAKNSLSETIRELEKHKTECVKNIQNLTSSLNAEELRFNTLLNSCGLEVEDIKIGRMNPLPPQYPTYVYMAGGMGIGALIGGGLIWKWMGKKLDEEKKNSAVNAEIDKYEKAMRATSQHNLGDGYTPRSRTSHSVSLLDQRSVEHSHAESHNWNE